MKYARPAGAASAASEGWTEARVALLRKLWAEGLSASQIAARLGQVTRNAVIGKVHREQLPRRKTTNCVPRGRKPMPRSQTRTKRDFLGSFPHRFIHPASASAQSIGPASAVLVPVNDVPRPLFTALLDLRDGHCRWPIGDPRDDGFAFCGCSQATAFSYCEHHARIAFQPASRRKR